MSSQRPRPLLPAASVKAILDSSRLAEPVTPDEIEAIRRWLETRFARAIKRAKPITMADVDRLARAHRRFKFVVDFLQDYDDAPPPIPDSEGVTAWEEWIDCFRVIPFDRGRREECDWPLIGALLALYEVTSGRRAAATPNGPTLRFLQRAFDELARLTPVGVRSYFHPPKSDALRHQLKKLKKATITDEKTRLTMVISNKAGK